MKQWGWDEELFDTLRRDLFTAVVGDIMDTMGLLRQFLPPQIKPLLTELREAKGLTQAELAERLGVSQPNVSKLEAAAASPHAGAIYLSTLGGYIAALGGHLEVRAVFPEHPEDDVVLAVGRGWVGGNPTPGVGTAEISERGYLLSFPSGLRPAQPETLLPSRSCQTWISWPH